MTAAFAVRDAMNDIDEAPGKVWFWELERAVIDAGRCVQCGVCVAACPSDSLGIGADDLPKLVKMCTGCSLCWDFCPRGGLRYEALGDVMAGLQTDEQWTPNGGVSGNGHAASGAQSVIPRDVESRHSDENGLGETRFFAGAQNDAPRGDTPSPIRTATKNGRIRRRDNLGAARERFTARVSTSIPGVQDGGVVSALLIELLESGEIDGALVAKPSETEPWKGVAHLAQTREDVIACAGSFYNQTLALGHLDLKKYDLPAKPRIALVGTPCEIQGLRAMQQRPFYWGASKVDAVVLTVALLCTKSFDYEGLMLREIQVKRGISLQNIDKIDIIRGKLYLYDDNGATLVEEPIRDFHGAALKGCDECADFLGVAADISVGSVGSEDGYSSVLIWTDAGFAAFQHVAPRLEIRELDKPQAIEKLDALDKSVAFKNLKRTYDPDAPLFIDYEAHLRQYAGTDRAPVTHEPVRY
ncbi:MAG TPA: Coenzyme F420 hydrogenase/dehydrogenase, beta subunit C-terminal domain [Thermomicrobiales bacterium]|nr:Coenzyme F420 hydrogenase/dehydrogenase, beta subunit C-terminal domain [Thermomicrobiales bacterium]